MRTLEITVKPNSRKTEILEESGNILKIALKAPPEHGKANLELLRFLRKEYKSIPRIVKGKTSRKKLVQITS